MISSPPWKPADSSLSPVARGSTCFASAAGESGITGMSSRQRERPRIQDADRRQAAALALFRLERQFDFLAVGRAADDDRDAVLHVAERHAALELQ